MVPTKYQLRLAFRTSFCLGHRGNHSLTAKTTSGGPLNGVKILDLTRVLAVSCYLTGMELELD